jgi:hypothetical protein
MRVVTPLGAVLDQDTLTLTIWPRVRQDQIQYRTRRMLGGHYFSSLGLEAMVHCRGDWHTDCGWGAWGLPFNTPRKVSERSLFIRNDPDQYNTTFSIMFEYSGVCATCINGPEGIIKFYTGMAHCKARSENVQTCHFEDRF